MQIQENISLKPFNTFGIDVLAKHFGVFENLDDLENLMEIKKKAAGPKGKKQDTLILGAGSNILLTDNFEGWVLKNQITGIEELHEDMDHVYIKAGAGENWHQFVMKCIDRNWSGLENLSLIPGNVGASPMQNIGAYGVELEDVFHSLEAFHISDKKQVSFSRGDCEFGYRNSVFKGKYKNEFVILSVTFRLRKQPIFHTSYGAITQELEKQGVKDLTIRAISNAVITIRRSKLPDPAIIGNAGSFFKNPTISSELFEQLKSRHEGIVGFPSLDGKVKLAAGWMIEQCGWKGYRRGDAGCHEKQALVLVNYGNASGKEIYQLSEEILKSVYTRYGVILEREVNIV